MSRLASAALAAAGVPQKVYTVPAGKRLAGNVLLINGTGQSLITQAKNAVGLAAPGLTFSNAQIASGQGFNGFVGSPYNWVVNNSKDALGSALFRGTLTGMMTDISSYLVYVDITNQLAPSFDYGASFSYDFPRDENDWNYTAANRFWYRNGSQIMRCLDATSSPFRIGTSVATITNVTYGIGRGDAAIACVSGEATAGRYVYTAAASAAAGNSVNASSLSAYTASFGTISAADYANYSYSRFFYVSGTWFFAHANASSQIQLWSTTTPQTPGSWKQHTPFNIWAGRDIANMSSLVKIGGYFYLLMSQYGQAKMWRTPDTLAAANPVWTGGNAGTSYSYNYPWHGLLRSDGRMMVGMNQRVFIDMTQANPDTVLPSPPGWANSLALGPNYANGISGKLAPVDVRVVGLHAVPTTGATDAANDLTIYGTDRIWRLVTDPTWGLESVTTAADWMIPSQTLANLAQANFGTRFWSANDEIWVRSTVAGLTVRIDGELIDAA